MTLPTALLSIAAATAACSSSSLPTSNPSTTATGGVSASASAPPTEGTAPTDSAPATASGGSGSLTTVGTVNYQSNGGYTWTVTVAFGSLVSVSDPSVDQSLVTACNADPATAGFIPLSITITSTAASFAEDTAASFTLTTDSSSASPLFPSGVSWTGTFAGGPHCLDASTASGEPWTVNHMQLAAGDSTVINGGLLISNWKSPNFPDGNPAANNLWSCQASISDRFDVPVVWNATSASGPNVIDSNLAGNNACQWYLPVKTAS